jgi:hypothetical protein
MRLKITAGCVLAALILFGSLFAAAPVPFPPLDLKVGAPVLGQNVPFFNKVFGPDDLVAVRPQNLFLLQEITAGRKAVLVGLQDLPHARAILTQAKNLGAAVVIVSLEGDPTKAIAQDILARAVSFARTTKKAGFAIAVIPRGGEQGFRLQPWLGFVDAVVIPAQGAQIRPEFAQIVGGIIARIKAAAPKVQAWVQVTANAPKDGALTAEAVLGRIAEISGVADGIFVVYGPRFWDTAKAVLLRLKNIAATAG